jgi:hypothetical protein
MSRTRLCLSRGSLPLANDVVRVRQKKENCEYCNWEGGGGMSWMNLSHLWKHDGRTVGKVAVEVPQMIRFGSKIQLDF